MEKNDLYFVPINDIAKRLDIPAHTLRYWEKQFPNVIKPTTGAGGRRYYRPEVVEKIATIKTLLYDRGMTIAGVKKMVHNGEFSNPDIVENPGVVSTVSITKDTETKEFASQSFDNSQIDYAIDLLKQADELL